jgi:hypothetical protein
VRWFAAALTASKFARSAGARVPQLVVVRRLVEARHLSTAGVRRRGMGNRRAGAAGRQRVLVFVTSLGVRGQGAGWDRTAE